MTGKAKNQRLRLGRRSDELGLSLIELLLSLAILALLAGFVISGLSIGRRAFEADRARASEARDDAAIQSLLSLIASALPYPSEDQNALAFQGSADSIRFVALSEGRALRGGAYAVDLRRVGSDLIVEVRRRPGAKKDDRSTITTAIVLRGVRAVHFGYFGTGGQPTWQREWHLPSLPNLVSVQVDFEDGRSSGPPAVIALRQD